MLQLKKWKRKIAVLLMAVMLLMTAGGCMGSGKNAAGNDVKAETDKTENVQSDTSEEGGGDIAMGRYAEEKIDLSEYLTGQNQNIRRLSDKSLVITDTGRGCIVSEDNGMTWSQETLRWHEEMVAEDIYILDMKTDADKNTYIIYDATENKPEDGNYQMQTKMLICRADGTQIPVEIALTEEDMYVSYIWISDNGRVFVTVIGSGNIYEVKEDGSCEKFLTLDESVFLIQFHGKYMIMDKWSFACPLIYDMEAEQYIEDEVLESFISENYKNRDYSGYSYDLYFFPGEEDVIYLAGEKGLYRHVIGGAVMEQVIDGALSCLGNPAYELVDMIMLDNHEFLALFAGGKLVHYTYDPSIPTVPNEKLTVYSLEENDTVRQAISLYQTANPEVFVEYEIGREEGSAVTREDALKSLNTRIMADEGPDVLVLDDMPADSYVEKGMLLNLKDTLDSYSGDEVLFENIVDAFRTEEGIYMIPCEIQLPVLLGEEKYISEMQSLAGIADGVEALRKDYPEKDLLRTATPRGVMRKLAMVCVPAWKTENGGLDREAVTEFLTQSKRVYDAQMDTLPEELVEQYRSMSEYYLQEFGEVMDDSDYFRTGLEDLGYIGGLNKLIWGTLTYPYSYASITSIDKVSGFESSKWIPMSGQSDKVFVTKTMVGISSASKQPELAKEFLKVMLGKENQSNLFWGLPANVAAFEKIFTVDEREVDEEGVYSHLSMGNGEGLYISLKIYWPDESQISEIRNCMETVNTPYVEDIRLESIVYEEGANYLLGKMSLKETVDAIEKQVSLYMAE